MGYLINRSFMADKAPEIVAKLRENGFGVEAGATRQVLCLAEETGELVGAYRRWSGQARRSGSFEDVETELADVVITAYVLAEELGMDLDAAIRRKLDVVFTRGWREGRP
jgi:NTP pyrophosphatase (non-canonical NTP hydrolase)